MSFEKCVQDAIDEGSADKIRGERAQKEWRGRADQYERQGHDRATAEAFAAEDVKAGFRKAAGDERHVALAKMANLRKMALEVNAAKAPDMAQTMERLEYQHRGLVRRFNARLSSFLKEHHRDILGRIKNPAQMKNIVRELHGDASGDEAAKALADGIRDTLEDMRLMFNEAGGITPKLENWGLPHSHNRRAVSKAGFDRWRAEIGEKIDWTRVQDPLTGLPMQRDGMAPPSGEVQDAFLREVYNNIAFTKESREAVYGRTQGAAKYKQHAEHRVLHFKTADDWIAYNRQFGSGDPFASLMGHVHRQARDIAMMREFGPNPALGADYRSQLWKNKARGNEALTRKVESDSSVALREFRVINGGRMPESYMQDWMATFFSSTRHVLTSAFLDRAVIASISDVNTMRLAAQSIGMNPANTLSRHVKLLTSGMSRAEAARAGWVADTLSDAGTTMARFQQEVPPAEIAERLASGAMRIQGLSHWTDMGRVAFQQEMGGLMASQAGKKLADVDPTLQKLLRRAGVTEEQWADFTHPDNLFKAGNGATFASPFWWRESTKMDARAADDLFDKIQGMVEEQLEYAVPTSSVLAQAWTNPAAFDLPPGSIPYEVMKSATMFKSFTMTFSVNQYRRIMSQPTIPGRIGYAMNLAGGSAIMGALALQIGDIAMGRDPQDMTDPKFWGRAAMKGGSFAIMGDIVATGQASWGGGFPSYIGGPVFQSMQDVWNLTIKNAYEFATGQDTNFAKEVGTFGKRYTPMGQTVLIGPALDRLFWDQLSILLDPDAAEAIVTTAERGRKSRGSSGDWWMPGSTTPSRAPNLRSVLGQ